MLIPINLASSHAHTNNTDSDDDDGDDDNNNNDDDGLKENECETPLW